MTPWWPPDLTPQQSEKIGRLHGEFVQRNRDLQQQVWEVQDRLNSRVAAEKRDWDAIRTASRHVFDRQRQKMDAAIGVQQNIDGLLTVRQRQKMARAWAAYGRINAQ
jgi:Spy/CpxP family protein refolding chaperone